MKRILIILLCTWLASFTSDAATLEVCKGCTYQSIKAAIATAKSGDTVIVKKGTYKEGNIEIRKPLVLVGEGFPVVDGENDSEIFTIYADSVTISGFQIQNVGTSYTVDRAGINVVKSDHVVIKNNKLINTFFGIYLQKSKHNLIENNEIIGEAEEEMSSGNAIHLWYCKNIRIENNTLKKHRDGIYLEFVDSSRIVNNVSEGNVRYGLHFMFSNHDEYIDNTFRDNGAGVAVMFSRYILMDNNLFDHNWGTTAYGILLKEIYDSEIINSTFKKNTTAIYGESATRMKIHNNTFEQNGWALRLLGSCMDNTIKGNNFYSNTFDVTTNSSRNYNEYSGNYWDEYTGYDLDKDGVGDVPYHPVKLFSYIVTKSESSIVLLRSLFIDILNFAEKVTPVFTPATLVDEKPQMKPVL
ncbi:nitrous oxide reductase family maturation protein NosD [Fulvivirga kasyanovii]|uniref:Nitrous oxide reductase family maturation protein NosD n=1 Tax=Fulvivirga kasyanovii TaxID=396812 RepID=A0ABW9RU20_9BACT|nr:nitrous oxide reductase family maturation protein NosD [Fulvivirga kasyanovii]